MGLPTHQIKEIAKQLECGMQCYVHRQTGDILGHPDPLDTYFDPEPWQEVMDQIAENSDDYMEFVKMDSRQRYGVIEDFIETLDSYSKKLNKY